MDVQGVPGADERTGDIRLHLTDPQADHDLHACPCVHFEVKLCQIGAHGQ